jgi:membrane protein implicated in regulation of membrane protease activity
VALSTAEFALLHALLTRPGETLSRVQLLELALMVYSVAVWQAVMWAAPFAFTLALLISALLVLGVAAWSARRLTTPLARLARDAAGVAEGETMGAVDESLPSHAGGHLARSALAARARAWRCPGGRPPSPLPPLG